MNVQALVRQFLHFYTAREPLTERLCSCGDANHVRLQLFRVDSRPAIVIAPEALEITPEQFRETAGASYVEPFTDAELDEICLETELGCPSPLENPFGMDVYFDESMVLYPNLVICPKMFGGKEGECYRIQTQQLLDRAKPVLLRFEEPAPSLDWGV